MRGVAGHCVDGHLMVVCLPAVLPDPLGGGREKGEVMVKVQMGICWLWVSLLSLPTMWKEEERRRGDGVSVPSDLVGEESFLGMKIGAFLFH